MDESRLEGGGESGVELMGEGWFACGMTDHMLACYRRAGVPFGMGLGTFRHGGSYTWGVLM